MKMFLACSQVGKFSPCILKIVDNVETSVFRVNFLFFSILYLFPLPFRIHKYDRYFKSNAENDPFQTTLQYFSALEVEKIKSSNKTKLPFIRSLIREKPFTFYVSSFIKLIFLLLLLGIESKIERGGCVFDAIHIFLFFSPASNALSRSGCRWGKSAGDGEKQVGAKRDFSLIRADGGTRKIQAGIRKQRENNLSGKWTVDRPIENFHHVSFPTQPTSRIYKRIKLRQSKAKRPGNKEGGSF